MLRASLARWAIAHLPLVGFLAAASCGPLNPDEMTAAQAASSGTLGVDYSFARPSPATLVADGYLFVGRYYAPADGTEDGKILFKSEADALIASGLSIIAVFEEGATNALNGYSQGVTDAQVAVAQANAAGQPPNRPIFFAIDFDASADGLGAIEPYFDGVASVVGLNRTGAYGGYFAINGLFNDGKIQWGWQTYAWSDGSWDPRAQARQIQNGILNGQADEDQSTASDFGQWGQSAPPTPCSLAGNSYPQATCTETLQCSNGTWVSRSSDASSCITGVEPSGACVTDVGSVVPQYTCNATQQCNNGVWISGTSGCGSVTGCLLAGQTCPQNACTETLQCNNGAWEARSSDPSSCATDIEPNGACVTDTGAVAPMNTCTSTLQCDNGVWVDRASDPASCL
jgi:hypothetical protein